MAPLDGSRTEANLRQAFAAESEAGGRFFYFAQRAETEGYPDIASLFGALPRRKRGTPSATSTTCSAGRARTTRAAAPRTT